MDAENIVKAVTEPMTKLIDAVSGAIGKAYEPRYIKRMADAKAYEIRKISDEMRNNSDLPIVYTGKETRVDISDYDGLRERAGFRLAYQEICKQENIENVVDKACTELEGETLKSEEQVSQDWMNRFISNVGEVSNKDMQSLWAKVLAREVISPDSFSYKSLDCLRNITADDAKLFSRICEYIVNNSVLLNDIDLNKKYGITFADIMRLDECGLINSGGSIVLNRIVNKDMGLVLDFKEYILMGHCNEGESQKIVMGAYPLTQAGREIFKIARTSKPQEEYLLDVVKIINQNSKGCKLSLHRVISRDNDIINYDKNEIK